MTANGWFQFFVLVIFLITKHMGIVMARVFQSREDFS